MAYVPMELFESLTNLTQSITGDLSEKCKANHEVIGSLLEMTELLKKEFERQNQQLLSLTDQVECMSKIITTLSNGA